VTGKLSALRATLKRAFLTHAIGGVPHHVGSGQNRANVLSITTPLQYDEKSPIAPLVEVIAVSKEGNWKCSRCGYGELPFTRKERIESRPLRSWNCWSSSLLLPC
jgi:hypothetical protein